MQTGEDGHLARPGSLDMPCGARPCRAAAGASTAIEAVRVDLDALPLHDLHALTTTGESDRAGRYRSPVAARRFLARRAAMRMLVAERLGVSPADVVLLNDGRGRPVVGGGGIHISQSSRRCVMIAALSTAAPVGCDVEEMLPDIDIEGIAALCFGPTERRALQAAGAGERLSCFYGIWTRLEAFLKARGTGFVAEPASGGAPGRPEPPTFDGRSEWTTATWAPLPGFLAAVAAPGKDLTVQLRDFPDRSGCSPAATHR